MNWKSLNASQLSFAKRIVCRSLKEMFKQMLTGAGSRFNGGNRWFDKTVQVGSDIISCSFKSCPQFIQMRNIVTINEHDLRESPSVGCFSRWSLRPLLRAFSQWGHCRRPIGNLLILKDVLWFGYLVFPIGNLLLKDVLWCGYSGVFFVRCQLLSLNLL